MTTGEIRKILKEGDLSKFVLIDPEELRLFEENERARELFSSDGIENLYKGVCEKAVTDYKEVHKSTMFSQNGKNPKTQYEKDLESFFGTDFFINNSGLHSKEHAIRVIENTMLEERRRKLQSTMV